MNPNLLADLKSRGLDSGTARTIVDCIAGALAKNNPAAAWERLSQNFLMPAQDFELHRFLYEQCYGENALLRSPGPAVFASEETVLAANVTAAARQLGLADYPALYRWSIENREAYWDLVVRRLNIVFRQRPVKIMEASIATKPQWLVSAKLNIVESCFQADRAAPAIIEAAGDGAMKTTTYGDLRTLAYRVANSLAARGIKPGDAVAMLAPMSAETIAAYLGVIAAGAAVVSIADSFAPDEIAARLRIADARLILTQDVVPWGAKRLPLYQKVAAAAGEVPIVVIATGIPEWLGMPLRNGDQAWKDFLGPAAAFTPVARQPGDTINILFSSGTTGEPKAIPWDHTTPIKCAADAHFHHDLHPGDITCWPTNLGWMMGPWLIFATLMNRCAMALFLQAPHERAFGAFVQNARVTMLGLVPSLLRAWRQSNCMHGLDWSAIRAFSSSGECSSAPDMLYLMHLAGYKPIIEYCGGTEIGGAYVTSTVVQTNIPAAFSTPALGVDFVLLDKNKIASTGEVFISGPSMGLSTRLLNRDHDEVYFKNTPADPAGLGVPLRRHGDELEALPHGYFRVAGRSDDTMNLGGIKVSCAEIERALSTIPDMLECAAIAAAPPGGGPSKLIIYTVLKPGVKATALTLKPLMQQAIREQLNPLFRVEDVIILPALPRTASNKILRRELRAMKQL